MIENLKERVADAATKKDGSIQHTTGKSVMLFPFTTSSGSPENYSEVSTKNTFVASVIRQLCGLKLSKPVNKDEVEERITKMVDTDNSKDLKHIVRHVAFDSSGDLLPFCEKAFLYVGGGEKKPVELANYFLNLYLNDSFECLKGKFNDPVEDIFHQLVLESFPELEKKVPKKGEKNYPVSDRFRSSFIIDLKSLCSGHKLRVQDLKKLFIYYLFAHHVEVALRFHRALRGKVGGDIPLYTMEWEKVSASREGYIGGWRRIEHCRKQLFSMSVCSELLNCTSVANEIGPLGYSEWVQLKDTINSDKEKQLGKELGIICDEYKSLIHDVNWEGFEPSEPSGEILVDSLRTLHEMVNYQFYNSSRKAAAGRYNDWLLALANKNFLKSRGPLGRTLTLTREWFLFLASLCAQSHGGRIRLFDFWEELRKRGVGLDHDSKIAAVSLLDRLGLLEKKSDSGDAQYVRSFI